MAEVSVSVIGKDLLSASFNTMQSSVAKLSTEVLNLGSRAVSPVTIALGNLLSDVVKNGVNAINNLKSTIESFSFIRLNMEMEMTRSSFTTLLKSGDEANKMLETLRQYANFTPFEFSQLTAATKKMLAFGFSAKEITTDFMGIGTGLLDVVGNAASALGAGQEGIDRITRALGQMRGLARVSAEDMNQLIDVGVQGYQILAEQLGMTVKEVRDAMKKGAIDAETGIKALLNGMMQQYGGGMASFAQTAEGMSSTLNDYIKDIQRTFGEIAYKEYRLLLTEVNRLVSSPSFAKFAQMLGVVFGGAIKRLSDDILKPAIQRMTTFVNQLGETDAAMQSFFNGLSQRIYPFFALFREFGNAIMKAVGIVTQFVRAIIDTAKAQQAISWLMRQVAKATEIFFDFADKTNVSGAAMAGFAMKVVDAVEPAALAIVRFTPVLKELGLIVAATVKEIFKLNGTQTVWRGLIDVYTNLSGTFDQLVPRLRAFRESIPELAQNIIASLSPARAVLSGFMDTIKSSVTFLVAFVKEVVGMRATQSTLASIPERLNQFAAALHNVARGIDDLTTKLPAFFQYIQTLPDTIRATVQSFLSLPSLIDDIKARILGLATEAVQALPPMSVVLDAVKEKFIMLAKSAFQFVTQYSIVGKVMNTAYEVFTRVGNALNPFIQFFMDFVQAILSAVGVSANMNDFFGSLAAGVGRVLSAIAGVLPSVDSMTTVFTAIATIVKAGFPIVIQLIGEVTNVLVQLSKQVTDVLPSVSPLISTIISVASGLLSELLTLIPDIASAAQRLAGDVLQVVDAVRPFKDMIVPAIESFILIMGAMQGASMAPMVAGMVVLSKHVGTLRTVLQDVLGALSSFVTIAASFSENVTPTLDRLLPAFRGLLDVAVELARVIGDNLAPVINTLSSILSPVLNALIGFNQAVAPMVAAFLQLVNTLLTAVAPFATEEMISVISWLTQGAGALTNFMNVASEAVRTGDFSTLSNMIKEGSSTIIRALGELVRSLLSPENVAWALTEGRVNLMIAIKNTLEEIFGGSIDEVSQKIPGWISGAKQYLDEFIPELLNGLSNSWTLLSNEFNISPNGILNAFSTMWDSIAPTISNLPQMIGDAWRDNAPAIQNGISVAWEWIKDQLRRLWNWIETDGMQGLDTAIRGLISLFSSGGWNDFMNEADRSITEAMGAIGELAGKMLVTALFDYLPSIVAQLLKFVFQLTRLVSNGMNNLISGLIQGMLRIIGMDEAADKVKAFFEGQINATRNAVNFISEALDRFTNFWNSIDITGTFRNFVRLVSEYFSTIFPKWLAGLAQIPEMLLNTASIGIKRALTDMVTVIQNAITSITDNTWGLSGVSDSVRATFQNMRDSINNIGGSLEGQMNAVSNWMENMNQVEQMTADLIRNNGRIVSYGIQQNNRAIQETAKTVEYAASKVNEADLDEFTASINRAQSQLRTQMASSAQVLTGTVGNMFESVGQQIANGIYDGFMSTWPLVADAIQSAIQSVSTPLSTVPSSTPNISSTGSVSTVNNKNVNLNVTINQTTSTTPVENLRYAQALANARIY
jgi:tape measure domain-containing protein